METDYISVTEIAGDEVTEEQIERLCNRYYWAGHFCAGKDVVETACGTGQGLGYLSSVSGTFEAGDYSAPLVAAIVIAIASGATVLSHVNDSGFWLVSRYLGLTEGQTFRVWTVMETLVGLTGFLVVLILSAFL